MPTILAWAMACGPGPTTPNDSASTPAGCTFDTDDQVRGANAIEPDEVTEGFLCPRGDQDWYAYTVPSDHELTTVSLSLDAPLSALGVTYAVWDAEGRNVLAAPDASEGAGVGAPLAVTHRLRSGPIAVNVRDAGGDAEDTQHPYALVVSSAREPDPHEPNDAAGDATDAGDLEAYVSYRGDEDWYAVDAPPHSLLEVRLTMPAGGFEPGFRIVDARDDRLYQVFNGAGTREPTDLSVVQALEEGGIYHVVVTDDDGHDSDAETPYRLSIVVSPDPDPNEPNDTPASATDLPDETCGAGWSGWSTEQGFLAAQGDADWYKVKLGSCDDGILQVSLAFDDPRDMPPGLAGQVRVVREVDQACSADQQCQRTTIGCDDAQDCAGYGGACLADGVCAGAGVCLGSGRCGANYTTVDADADAVDSVELAVPVEGLSPLWVVVGDAGSDAASAVASYTLRVRTRDDPDPHEPSDTWTAGPPTSDDAAWRHLGHATPVPVLDCAGGTCCDGTTWIEGSLGWSWDQDWYTYEHPCPGEDCMVRVVWALDPGPVDFYFQIYQEGSSWFDNLTDTTDLASHVATSGAFGGLQARDTCFYAWQGHTGSPFHYAVTVRDTNFVSQSDPVGGTWDFDADQGYRFCVEKLAAGCQAPCELFSNGCGSP